MTVAAQIKADALAEITEKMGDHRFLTTEKERQAFCLAVAERIMEKIVGAA